MKINNELRMEAIRKIMEQGFSEEEAKIDIFFLEKNFKFRDNNLMLSFINTKLVDDE